MTNGLNPCLTEKKEGENIKKQFATNKQKVSGIEFFMKKEA